MLDVAKNRISLLKNNKKLPDELQNVCQAYLVEYTKLRKRYEDPNDNVTRTEILEFVDVYAGRFSEDFRSVFNELNNSLTSDLEEAKAEISYLDDDLLDSQTDKNSLNTQISDFDDKITSAQFVLDSEQQKIDELDSQITTLESGTPHQWILEKAFPSIDPATIQKAKHAVKNAKEKVKTAEEVQAYFADDTNRNAFPISYIRFNDRLKANEKNESVALVHKIDTLKEEIETLKTTRDSKKRDGELVEGGGKRDELTEKINKRQKQVKELVSLQSAAKSLHEAMKTFAQYAAKLIELSVITKPSGVDIKVIMNNIESLDIDSPDFKCDDLSKIYKELEPYYKTLKFDELDDQFHETFARLEQDIKDAEENLKSLEKQREANTNLDDAVAAKKIVQAIVTEQYPDLPLEEQEKLAVSILADDVQTIQTEQSYQELAESGHAELLETANMVGVQGKLVNVKWLDNVA